MSWDAVSRDYIERFSKGGRRDQGVALQCGPRPVPRVTALGKADWSSSSASVSAKTSMGSLTSSDVKSALESWLQDDDEDNEETAELKQGSKSSLPSVRPVVCGAYRVHDPQNLGAICRSALFFGLQQVRQVGAISLLPQLLPKGCFVGGQEWHAVSRHKCCEQRECGCGRVYPGHAGSVVSGVCSRKQKQRLDGGRNGSQCNVC